MNALPRILFAVVGFAFAASACAQDGPVRILVGFPPGGESDIIARLIIDRMRTSLGAPVIVENKPGAGGMLAAEALKNAVPDGRTLMISPIAVTVFAPLTHTKLRYDPIKDFAPVSLAADFHMALAVGPGSPAKTLHEYIAWVRANPAKATYGVPLAGGPTHFFGVMLARATGVDLAVVPYKGSAPFVNDLIGGQVPAGITYSSTTRRASFACLRRPGHSARLWRRMSPRSRNWDSRQSKARAGRRFTPAPGRRARQSTAFQQRSRQRSRPPRSASGCSRSAWSP